MNPFWLAWSFLTVLPAPHQKVATAEEFVRSRIWYPAIGLIMGGVWVGSAYFLRHFHCPSGIQGVVLLAVPLVVTGLLHFDGLLDSADALLAPCTPERRLEILKDVSVGSFAMGVGGLWLLLTSQILSLNPSCWFLLGLPVVSRGTLLVSIYLFPYARQVDSSSLSHTTNSFSWRWIVPVLSVIPVFWFFPMESIAVLGIQLGVATWAAKRLDGGITGDVYGALLCLSETAALALHVLRS